MVFSFVDCARLQAERFEPTTKSRQAREEAKAKAASLSSQEAVAYALLYNNLSFLLLVLLLAFFVLKTLPAMVNYGLSLGLSAALVFITTK